jgi:Zn-dependent protease with chaperone function
MKVYQRQHNPRNTQFIEPKLGNETKNRVKHSMTTQEESNNMTKVLVFTACVLFALATPVLRGQSKEAPAPTTTAAPAQAGATTQTTPVTAATNEASKDSYQLSPEKLRHAIAITRVRNILTIVSTLWGLLVLWVILATRLAAKIERWVAAQFHMRWIQGIFYFAIFIIFTTLADLPLSLYGEHVERHFGVSVQSWGGWFVDWGKGLGLGLVVGILLLLFLNWLVKVSPRRYWVWTWVISLPLLAFAIIVSPYIANIFVKSEPLELHHAALVTRLETLVARTGTSIPRDKMFLALQSEKSNGVNAYVAGFGGTKRMVIWDTTADRLPEDEIVFIFGHESGHYVLNHIPKEFALDVVIFFILFLLTAKLGEWIFRKHGAKWGIERLDSRAGFTVLLLGFSIVVTFLTPGMNTVSRYFEHQADVYGQEAIHSLVADPQKTAVASFNHMGELWLEDPNPNAFMEFWFGSHPSVGDRANFAAHYDPWANGGHGEFFDK